MSDNISWKDTTAKVCLNCKYMCVLGGIDIWSYHCLYGYKSADDKDMYDLLGKRNREQDDTCEHWSFRWVEQWDIDAWERDNFLI